MVDKLPLDGITVLDLTQVLSGPFATLILSDLGAKIIKVEKPGGDDARKFSPIINSKSGYFISLNRGKKSIVLNLKTKNDKAIFFKLLSKSDVLIENFKPGVLEKLGLSWNSLKKKYPKLIVSKISGFGQTGPLSKLPAYDMVVQAMGGIMSITGDKKGNIVRVGTSIGDITAGLYSVIGILAALINRNNTKIGSKLDISMLDCQIAILESAISRYSITKNNPKPMGVDHPSIAPFGLFKTKDKPIVIAVGNEKIFKSLCECITRLDLFHNESFKNNNLRVLNLELLRKEIENTLKKRTSVFWLKKFNEQQIPSSTVDSIDKVVSNPQVLYRNMIKNYKDAHVKDLKVSGNPIKLSGVRENKKSKLAPDLNENKIEILKEFGIKII